MTTPIPGPVWPVVNEWDRFECRALRCALFARTCIRRQEIVQLGGDVACPQRCEQGRQVKKAVRG